MTALPPRARLADLPAPPAGRRGWPWTEEHPQLPGARPDGRPWPRFSIVTAVYNQGRYLEATLRSVLLQGYPALEYVVVDDGSTDDSAEVARRYAPWLARFETQPNRGQRSALNRGFELAGGELLGFLNSDDLLLPGALERAALELDPARGRHVVVGRCRFTDAYGQPTGLEHPAAFESHLRLLQVWKGHTLPQPSVFWTAEAWREGGPIRSESWVDYDLFCSLSRRHRFQVVDQLLSTYRLHDQSKTCRSDEQRRLSETVAISRRYWGGPLAPRRWRLEWTWALHRLDRRGRGRRLLRAAGEELRQGRRGRACEHALAGALLAPDVVWSALLFPALRARLPAGLARRVERALQGQQPSAQTLAYLEHTVPWPDGWAGPRVLLERRARGGESRLRVEGQVEPRFLGRPLTLEFLLDGEPVGQQRLESPGQWPFELALPRPVSPGLHTVEVRADAHFVPDRLLKNGDQRPLSWRLLSLELAP